MYLLVTGFYAFLSHLDYLYAAVAAYLCGCFNGALFTSRLFFHDDVRTHGSGNAGLTNFYRTYGARYALFDSAAVEGFVPTSTLRGQVRDLTDITEEELALLERTPGSAIGTSRDALEEPEYRLLAEKCVEFGAGAAVSRLRGSAHNDAFYYDEAGRVRTRTNRHGGVLGGMTTGMPLLLTCHIKPTPSIALPQESVNLQTHESARLCVPGRHDPCAALRAVPCVEAAAAIALLDLYQEGLIDGIG